MTTHLAPVSTTHLEPIRSLSTTGLGALLGLIAAHFVSSGVLDRETLGRYVAEAEAVTS